MRRSLVLLAILLILITVGCSAPPKPPPEPTAQPSSASSSGLPPAPATSSSSATTTTNKKRTRTSAAKPPPQDGTKPKNGRALNPKDSTGRTVFVRADDQCFVEVPPKGSTEVVDCPNEANDPAFDHCTSQIVLEEGSAPEKCYCVNGAIVPRPMPNPTPCPKH